MHPKEGTSESASCGGAPKCPSLWLVASPSPLDIPHAPAFGLAPGLSRALP